MNIPHLFKYNIVHILCEQTELPTSPIALDVLAATERIDIQPAPPLPPSQPPPSITSTSFPNTGFKENTSQPKLGKKVSALVAALDQQHLTQSPLSKSISGPSTSESSTSSTTTNKTIQHFKKQKSEEQIIAENSKKMDYYSDAASMVSFSGLNEPCSIGSIVEVVINAQGDKISNGDVNVYAESPSGKHLQCNVIYHSNSFTATFTPSEVGEWKIGILYDNEHIRGSPFNCSCYDANLVQVYGLDVGLVGQELKFTIDAHKAGVGDVGVTILREGRQISCEIEEEKIGPRKLPTGKFRISFTPNGAGKYKIHIAFNNMEVKGSPFILDIADANSVSVYGDNLRMAAVDRLSTFMVHAAGAESKDLSVVITGGIE
uniref:Uncharacterized protein n=1 Tax=Panagrolaimus davidi TaxID=227884 RepID=A0A914P2T7_9BILA